MSVELPPVGPDSIEAFFDYLRFPTISADPGKKEAMRDCVEWLRERFNRIGFDARILGTAGAPAFLASSPHDLAKKTILIYGHYDVQPVDPLNLWRHAPFEPVIEEGYVIARGATDNKGQTFSHILGTEAAVRDGALPVNLIYLIEGEEEIGSANLEPLLNANRDLLRCDAIVISDTSTAGPDFPAITCGLRGIVCLEVRLRGARTDLHSGMYGGVIDNPAAELARLLARLHDPTGAIAISGFYDNILPPTARELAGWRGIPFDEAEILRATGARALGGEATFTPLERIWTRPTAEINGLTSGYQGAGSKTIIPAEASAKLSFRLVPGQDPDRIAELAREFLMANCQPALDIDVTYDHGGEPYYASPDSPASLAAQRALAAVFGREPALLREGLSIPVVSTFRRLLGRDPLLIGLGMPDCAAHAPNETFPLVQLQRGILLHRELLREFAASL